MWDVGEELDLFLSGVCTHVTEVKENTYLLSFVRNTLHKEQDVIVWEVRAVGLNHAQQCRVSRAPVMEVGEYRIIEWVWWRTNAMIVAALQRVVLFQFGLAEDQLRLQKAVSIRHDF